MYESPIKIIQDKIQTEYENGILRAVQKFDIHCNKEELTKALAYDRDQYRKGYEDAKPRWIPCSERLPKRKSDWKNVTVLDESGDTKFTYSSVGFYLSDGCWIVDNEPMEDNSLIRVIAWMPLPEPYTESEVDE